MPDIFLIVNKWWKAILAITVAALAVAFLVLQLLPKQYLSTTTALPANSVATDKGWVFNGSIQELYSSLGSAGELDRFLGTAKLDTVYIAVAKRENLAPHYGLKADSHALYNAAQKLKKNTRIDRTEYGELQIKVWDEDRDKAAALANGVMQELQLLHQQLQSGANNLVLQKLKDTYTGLNANQRKDSLETITGYALVAQGEQLQQLIAQYSLMVSANPPSLLLVERARPALAADKPYVWPTMLLTLFAALLFGLLTAVFMERRTGKNV